MALPKSILLGLVLAVTPKIFSQFSTADLPEEIQIPEIMNQNVRTEGLFSTGEWVTAKEYILKDGYSLLFMADQNYLYTALRFPESMGECVMELRITPDGKRIHVLHVSGDLGEGVSDFPQNPEFIVGVHNYWESNPTRIDSVGRQAWYEAGQPLERYDEIYIPRAGIEFRISRDKLAGKAPRIQAGWIRVDVIEGKIVKNVYNYPLKSGFKNAEHWSRLVFMD